MIAQATFLYLQKNSRGHQLETSMIAQATFLYLQKTSRGHQPETSMIAQATFLYLQKTSRGHQPDNNEHNHRPKRSTRGARDPSSAYQATGKQPQTFCP